MAKTEPQSANGRGSLLTSKILVRLNFLTIAQTLQSNFSNFTGNVRYNTIKIVSKRFRSHKHDLVKIIKLNLEPVFN